MKNDLQIQQDVVAALDRDEHVPTGSVGVEVHHGVVKLVSRATDATIANAEIAARHVAGVTEIVLDMGSGQR